MSDEPTWETKFKTSRHIEAGAPKEFYEGLTKVTLEFPSYALRAYIAKHRDTWMRDLLLIERVLWHPSECVAKTPESIEEELTGRDRVLLRGRTGGLYCECSLMKLDGRFFVPLVGVYAPVIKEIA